MTAKLPAVVDKLDAVPEGVREMYVEQDGKYVLDVDVEQHPGTAGLRGKRDELLKQINEFKPIKSLIGRRTPDQLAEELAQLEEIRTKQAAAAGDFETLKQDMATKHAEEMELLRGELESVEEQLYDLLATSAAKSALKEVGFDDEVMLPHMLPHIDVIKEDGSYVARVVDENGKLRAGDASGTPMSIKQLAESFAQQPRFAGVLAASGASGGGARNTPGGAAAGGAVVVIPKNSTPQEYRRLKGEAEKRGVPYRVAE